MKASFERIPASLSQEPIALPGSPFWNVFKRFGRDEAIAMLVNVAGTALAALATANAFILSITGPVVEKLGFFPAHFREAFAVYRTTPLSERKALAHYFKKAVKGGGKSLLEDVLVHDPFYIALMFIGLRLYKGTPVWMLASASFLIAVLIVTFGEVLATELSYLNFKRRMKKKGFGLEKYYEARFLISSRASPKKVINMIAQAFGLELDKRWIYNDTYFESRLPEYSGRTAKIRLRQRVSEKGKVQTAQVVYTRAYELSKRKLDQYRYFPIRKEKLFFRLGQQMPKALDEIKDANARIFLKKASGNAPQKSLSFQRMLARSADLLVSVDTVHGRNPFFLLELKSRKNIKLMKEAMRFVMTELPVVQTTQGKKEIVFR